jgi:type IV pilus assembly protein PilC
MLLFPHVFAQEQVAMVRAGEESGELSQVLERMSMFYDKNTAIMSRLRNALIYPAVIGTAAFGVMIFVSIKFIPQIKDLYAQFRAPLPWPTLAVDFVSGFIRRQPWLWGFIGFGIYRFIKYWPTFYAKQAVQRFFVSKTGPLGDLILRLFIARALRSVAMLLNAGVPVQDAYRLAAAITTYVDFQVMFISLRQDILAGVSIFRSINRYRHYFRKHGFYIASYIRMAEQGGEVGIVMARLAEYYEREVDARMANIDKLVEPITVIFLGAAICFLLISVYYPIFALASYVIPGVKH